MNVEEYVSAVIDGFEFLIALGSLLGLLGLIAGFVLLFLGGHYSRRTAFNILIVSFILVCICGLYTGVKYFHI